MDYTLLWDRVLDEILKRIGCTIAQNHCTPVYLGASINTFDVEHTLGMHKR